MATVISTPNSMAVLVIFLIIAVPLMAITLYREHAAEKKRRLESGETYDKMPRQPRVRTRADWAWMILRIVLLVLMIAAAVLLSDGL